MTKMKANLVLIVSGILGIVNVVGNLGPHRKTFEMAYGVFYATCIFSSCILYIITYCSTQRTVTGLHWKMQRRQIITVKEATIHPNVPVPLSQPRAFDRAERMLFRGSCRGKSKSLTALQSKGSQGGNSERNKLVVPGKLSLRSKSLSNEVPERSMEINTSSNDDAMKYSPRRNSSMPCQDHGNQQVASQIKEISNKAEKTRKNRTDTNNPRTTDSDIGRAMLFIVVIIMLCYIPIAAEGMLLTQNTDSTVLEHVAMILLLANSSCNAIILTVFCKDVRNLAKRLL